MLRKVLQFIIFTKVLFSSVSAQQVITLNDRFTGEKAIFRETSKALTGRKLTSADCDDILVKCNDGKTFLRVLDKSQYVNVKWFGAKGDGDVNDLGTDDTAAVESALATLSKIRGTYNLSGGNEFGGFTLFFPAGKYLLSRTLVLPEAAVIVGESTQSVVLHAIQPQYIFTNVHKVNPNGDLISSSAVKISSLTFTQGGIQMHQSAGSRLQNLRIMNLHGDNTQTGLSIKLPVDMYVADVKIFGSGGTCVDYADDLGSGPSTTTTFDRIWLSHCKVGMRINGGSGGSHGILTSKIYNSIIEYTDTGLQIEGNVDSFAIRDTHFEQNKNADITIKGQPNIFLSNLWSDSSGIKISKELAPNAAIYLENVRMQIHNAAPNSVLKVVQ